MQRIRRGFLFAEEPLFPISHSSGPIRKIAGRCNIVTAQAGDCYNEENRKR